MAKVNKLKSGCVAKCSRGILGVITSQVIGYRADRDLWRGVSFDGRTWQSDKPIFVAHSISDYIERLKTGQL